MICASVWMVYQTGSPVKSTLQQDPCLTEVGILQPKSKIQHVLEVEREYQKKLDYYESKLNRRSVSLKDEKCTLVMLTFKRVQTLPRILKHYCRVSILSKIIVIWNDVDEAIPVNITKLSVTCNVQLLFIKASENRLTNRFIPRPELQSDCKSRVHKYNCCCIRFYIYIYILIYSCLVVFKSSKNVKKIAVIGIIKFSMLFSETQ